MDPAARWASAGSGHGDTGLLHFSSWAHRHIFAVRSEGAAASESQWISARRASFDVKKSSSDYPFYEVITIDDLTDVVEHRAAEPTFYMTDNPVVRQELEVPANQRLERP